MINEFYLKAENQKKLPALFLQNKALPSIKLQKFLEYEKFMKLRSRLRKTRFDEKKDPMAYSYSISHAPLIDFNTRELNKLISIILKRKIKKIEGAWHSFAWKDYTLLNDENLEKKGIDLIFDASDSWQREWGGMIIYTDGSGNSTQIEASSNTLLLIHRKKNVQRFVKYVNNKAAKNKRYLFLGRIQ